MKLSLLVLFASLVLLQATRVFATAQAADKIIYQNEERMLFANPLEDFFKGKDRPRFMIEPFVTSSGNWRGYIATWEIDKGTLFLRNVDSFICSGNEESSCKKVELNGLFDGKVENGRVKAEWFTGKLRMPDGKQLQYVHMGYGSSYERDIIIEIKKGTVGDISVIDNTKAELPNPMTAAKSELELLKDSNIGQQPMFGPAARRTESPKAPREPKSGLVIVPGTGVFKYGSKREDIEAEVGDGEPGSKYEDVYFVEYPKAGVQVSYKNSDNTVHVIFLYNGQARYEGFSVPNVKTENGVSWSSSAKDILKAYGKPLNNFGGGKESWQRLEYPGIDFRFENGKLGRIGILGPDEN